MIASARNNMYLTLVATCRNLDDQEHMRQTHEARYRLPGAEVKKSEIMRHVDVRDASLVK